MVAAVVSSANLTKDFQPQFPIDSQSVNVNADTKAKERVCVETDENLDGLIRKASVNSNSAACFCGVERCMGQKFHSQFEAFLCTFSTRTDETVDVLFHNKCFQPRHYSDISHVET